MNNFNYEQRPPQFGYSNVAAVENEMTLSSYVNKVMRRVFGKMTLGLLITAIVSLTFVSSGRQLLKLIFESSPLIFWSFIIVEFGVVVLLSSRINKMKATTASVLFYLYAVLTGITLTPIFFLYTGAVIVKTFFITAGTFGAMAIYGYTTKKDLSKIGSILYMCLIGVIIATIVNVFMKSSTLDWAISFAGVAIFIGLTAWDTQKIKRMSAETVGSENVSKVATIGALSLYLDFINLFIYLLRIFGSRD